MDPIGRMLGIFPMSVERMNTSAFFALGTVFAVIFGDTQNTCIKRPKDPTTRHSQPASEADKIGLCNIPKEEKKKQRRDAESSRRLPSYISECHVQYCTSIVRRGFPINTYRTCLFTYPVRGQWSWHHRDS